MLVGFYIGGTPRLRASKEFEHFVHVDMIDRPNSYYRVDHDGYYRDPLRYGEELLAFGKRFGIGPDRIMTWGSSRGATMALAVGLNLGVRCILAAGPQIDALADISFITRHGLQGVASKLRADEQIRWLHAIHRSVRLGKMDQRAFFMALQGLDNSNVLLRAPSVPRTFVFIGADNVADNYQVEQFAAAARSRNAPVWIYRFPTKEHAILVNHKMHYLEWLRAIWDGEMPSIPKAAVTAC
jgi:acetyl esterase/lipase